MYTLYCAEIRTMRKEDITRLVAFEMKVWRRMEKISWTEHISNEVLKLLEQWFPNWGSRPLRGSRSVSWGVIGFFEVTNNFEEILSTFYQQARFSLRLQILPRQLPHTYLRRYRLTQSVWPLQRKKLCTTLKFGGLNPSFCDLEGLAPSAPL